MKRRPDAPGVIAMDSSVLLAYLLGESLGEVVRSDILAREDVKAYLPGIAIAELFYILCRRKGEQFAKEATEALLQSGLASLVSHQQLDIRAGRYKCDRNLPLADCYVLALGRLLGGTAVFARREADLTHESSRKDLGVRVLFLEDLAKPRTGHSKERVA